MGLFDFFKSKPIKDENKGKTMYAYDEKHYAEVEAFVEEKFGKFDTICHELYSSSLYITGSHIDVAVIPPNKDGDCYKLVTIGAGSYKMNVPDSLKGEKLERAEFILYMPANWNFATGESFKVVDKKDWPINVLKRFARMPMLCDSWIATGHTMSLDAEYTHFSEETKLCGALCLPARDKYGKDMACEVSGLGKINFYVLATLYEEELELVREEGFGELIKRFTDNKINLIVDINRKNCATE